MQKSSNQVIAIILSVLLTLLPMQSSMAGFADSISASGQSHNTMMTTGADNMESLDMAMHDGCEHCESGECNMALDCYTGACFTVTATTLASSFYIGSKKTLAYPAEITHLVSAISNSLYRPPRH